MRRLLFFLLALLACADPAWAARGCGPTLGVGSTDALVSTFTTSFTGTVTYAFWVNIHGNGTSGRVMNKGAALTTVDAILATLSGVSYFPAFSTTRGQWQTNVAPSANVWHHVAIVYDGSSSSNTPVFYVDGTSVGITQVAAPVGTRSSDGNAYALCSTTGKDRVFDGKLSDYAMWNVMLNAAEVVALAKGSSPLRVRPSALQFYAPLSGVGTTEPDWGPNRATFTITGTTVQNQPPVGMFPYNMYDRGP